jgi:RNA polymerase sigma factor (sigma-70 family)
MNNDSCGSDVELWNGFLSGDSNSFDLLMKKYYNDLFFYGQKFSSDIELVKDCIQDVFLTLWKNKKNISQTQFVKFYLLRSVRRQIASCTEGERKIFTKHKLEFQDGTFTVNNKEVDLIKREELQKKVSKVEGLLNELPKRQQEIIFLRFYMEADATQIADILQIKKQSVYNLLNEALKRLKNNNKI